MIFCQFSIMRQKKVKFFNLETNDQMPYADYIFNQYMCDCPNIIIDIFLCYAVMEKKYYPICFPRELSQTSAGMVV